MFSEATVSKPQVREHHPYGKTQRKLGYGIGLLCLVRDTTCLESPQVIIKSVSTFWSKTYCSLSASSVSVAGHDSTHKLMTHNTPNMEEKKTLF